MEEFGSSDLIEHIRDSLCYGVRARMAYINAKIQKKKCRAHARLSVRWVEGFGEGRVGGGGVVGGGSSGFVPRAADTHTHTHTQTGALIGSPA